MGKRWFGNAVFDLIQEPTQVGEDLDEDPPASDREHRSELRVGHDPEQQLDPRRDLLLDESIVKVFHAASQDLEIFLDKLGRVPGPVFDTQIAASVCGLGEQPGYASLVSQMLGIEVDKASQVTDWSVRPLTLSVDLHPGELQHTTFLVHNRSAMKVTAQAIPSVSPGQAASHFEKIECFCFAQQTLLPGEAREMPLSFIVKAALSEDIRTITLAYAFFQVPEDLRTPPAQ